MWAIIRDLVAGGVTILLTTQYLEEADRLADRIAVLDQGKVVAEGTPDELKRRIPGGHILLRFASADELAAAAGVLGAGVLGAGTDGAGAMEARGRDEEALTLRVPTDGGVESLRSVLDRLDGAGVLAAGVSVHTPDLDDVFLALTGHAKARTDAGDAGVASNTGDTGDGGARPAAGRPHAPSTTRKGEPR